MTAQDFASVAFYLLGSVGGAAVLVFTLSSWLGKVWAQRIMDKERAEHERDLAALRSKLEGDTARGLEALRTDLSIFKEQHLKGFHDKVSIYRMVADLIVEVLGDFDLAQENSTRLNPQRMDQFNRQRMKAYGYLGMLASQQIMDAYDKLMDHLLVVSQGTRPYVWNEVRGLAINLLNEIRADLKFDETPIAYRGAL